MRDSPVCLCLAAAAMLLAGRGSAQQEQVEAVPQERFTPYAVVSGSVQYNAIWNQEGSDAGRAIVDGRQDRFTTLALSRVGLTADLSDHVRIESEFELNAQAYGTSVWEGQAAIQVNNQLLRLARWGAELSLGRVTDPASVNFVSDHVRDQLLMDFTTRLPLLESGFNRGYGILAGYEIGRGLKVGLAFNSASPLSTTGGYLIAGKFPHMGETAAVRFFPRLYLINAENLRYDASKVPDGSTHLTMLSPSLRFCHSLVEAQAEVQLLWADSDTSSAGDDVLFGANLRLGAQANLLDGMLKPFANFSLLTQQIHDYQATGAQSRKVWSGQDYRSLVVTVGLDFNYWGHNGVGLQYSYVGTREGEGISVNGQRHFINLGTSFWITETVALSARVAVWTSRAEDLVYDEHNLEWSARDVREGEKTFVLALRKEL